MSWKDWCGHFLSVCKGVCVYRDNNKFLVLKFIVASFGRFSR